MAFPIAWDWYKGKVDITVQLNSVASVISKDLPIQNLEMLYSGKKVEALNRISIQIENTGRTPITADDVIKPIELNFHDTEIIEAKIIGVNPSNLDFSLNTIDNNKIVANFSLMNPKDRVSVDILLLGLTTKFDAKARIKNIDEINIIDNLGNKDANQLSLYIFPMVIFSLLLTLVGITELLPSWPKKFRALRMLLNATHNLYDAKRYEDTIKNLFEEKVFSSKQQEYLLGLFYGSNFPLAAAEKENIKNEISKQEFFRNKFLITEFLVELFLLVVFGLLPTLGFIQVYFLSKI